MSINALIANPMIANAGNYSAPIRYKQEMDFRNALSNYAPPDQNALMGYSEPMSYGTAQEGDPRRGMFPTDAVAATTDTAFDNMSRDAMNAYALLSRRYPNLKVKSAYRDSALNKKVGGANRSQHMNGNAFDFDVSGMSREERLNLIRYAKSIGFRGVGIYNNALHFDVGPERAWGPDYHKETIPGWAKAAL